MLVNSAEHVWIRYRVFAAFLRSHDPQQVDEISNSKTISSPFIGRQRKVNKAETLSISIFIGSIIVNRTLESWHWLLKMLPMKMKH